MEYYLQHHGILGMKWGIRRYQNEDGSLTEEGKQRKKQYKEANQFAEERRKHKQTMSDDANDVINAGRKGVEAGRSALRIYDRAKKGKEEPLDLSKMSDQELQKAINRMNLENNYSRLVSDRKNVSAGRQKVQEMLDNAGDALVIAGSVATIALTIKQLRG